MDLRAEAADGRGARQRELHRRAGLSVRASDNGIHPPVPVPDHRARNNSPRRRGPRSHRDDSGVWVRSRGDCR